MRLSKLIYAVFILLLINGCAPIGQKQAEAKAVQFVDKNVKFFAREENSTLDLPKYSIDRIDSYQENKNWVVLIHVSAKVGNDTKKNDLVVKLNGKGDVVEFNGKGVPQ